MLFLVYGHCDALLTFRSFIVQVCLETVTAAILATSSAINRSCVRLPAFLHRLIARSYRFGPLKLMTYLSPLTMLSFRYLLTWTYNTGVKHHSFRNSIRIVIIHRLSTLDTHFDTCTIVLQHRYHSLRTRAEKSTRSRGESNRGCSLSFVLVAWIRSLVFQIQGARVWATAECRRDCATQSPLSFVLQCPQLFIL